MTDRNTQLVILARGLQAVTDEMAANLIRSAFSAVVREARDCSTALLDAQGRVVAQADMIPMQTAGLSESFRHAAAQLDLSGVTEDDFVLLNDPYAGGQHLNDLIVFTPILREGELLGWAGSTAHHLDIGGGSAGINTTASEVLQEGIVIPPLLLSRSRDWFGGMVEKFFFANIRTPEIGRGDLDAQFAANLTGTRRVLEMVQRHGVDTVRAAMAEVMDYSERRMRAAIAAIPDGSWTGEAWMDSYGATPGVPVAIRVRVTIKGDEAELDFTGSADQAKSMFNSPMASSMAAALAALRSLLTDTDLPANDGCNRPVTLKFPPGSLLNPYPGATVRARGTAGGRVLDAVHAALAQILPDRAPAQGTNTTTGLYLAYARPGGGFDIHLDVLGGGWGAAKGYDAIHATDFVLSSCRLTPSESIEILNSHLRIEATGLVEDGWGAGEFNGGVGLFRRYRMLKDNVTLNLYSDRFALAPKGMAGGHDGHRASLVLTRGDEVIPLGATSNVTLQAGDLVEIRLPGGGGWGDPAKRDRAAIARDIEDGYVSAEFAAREYGYAPVADMAKESI